MKKAWIVSFAVAVIVSVGVAGSFAQEKKAENVNTKCPVAGKDAKADCVAAVKVAFCCNNCKGKFEKDPVPMLVKVDKVPNEKCPASGKAIDAAATASVNVAFCCGNCKGKFEKDPGAYLSKIEAAKK